MVRAHLLRVRIRTDTARKVRSQGQACLSVSGIPEWRVWSVSIVDTRAQSLRLLHAASRQTPFCIQYSVVAAFESVRSADCLKLIDSIPKICGLDPFFDSLSRLSVFQGNR